MAELLDQLWYTSCPRGIENSYGFTVRAASTGLMARFGPRIKSLDPYLRYTLPAGANPRGTSPEIAPVALTFADLNGERALINTVYLGRDWQGERYGNYFAHAVTGLPTGYTLRDAILLWQSSFWQTNDQPLPADQFELPRLSLTQLHTQPIDPITLFSKVDEGALAFVIQAFLSLTGEQRLFIGAAPELVAAYIAALAQALPVGLLAQTTFTTYTHEPMSAKTRIVGTCWLSDQMPLLESDRDMPAACYPRQGYAINEFSGRRSTLISTAHAEEFAKFAAHALHRDLSPLSRLVEVAEAKGITSLESYLLLYRLATASSGAHADYHLSDTDMITLLRDPTLAATYLDGAAVLQRISTSVAENSEWWSSQGEKLLAALSTQAQQPANTELRNTLQRVAETMLVHAVAALHTGRDRVGQQLYEKAVVPLRAWDSLETLQQLLLRLNSPGQSPGRIHVWLLRQAAPLYARLNSDSQSQLDRSLMPWFTLTIAEVAELAAGTESQIPPNWLPEIIRNAVDSWQDPPPAAAPILLNFMIKTSTLWRDALTTIARNSKQPTNLARFFAFAAAHKVAPKNALLSAVLDVFIMDPAIDDASITSVIEAASLSLTEIQELAGWHETTFRNQTKGAESLVALTLRLAPSFEKQLFLLRSPALAAAYLMKSEIQQLLLNYLVIDLQLWQGKIASSLQQLQHVPATMAGQSVTVALHSLAKTMVEAADAAFHKADIHRVNLYMEGLMSVVGPEMTARLRETFLQRLYDHYQATFSSVILGERRVEFLRQAAKLPQQSTLQTRWADWLQMPWEDLDRVLAVRQTLPTLWVQRGLDLAILHNPQCTLAQLDMVMRHVSQFSATIVHLYADLATRLAAERRYRQLMADLTETQRLDFLARIVEQSTRDLTLIFTYPEYLDARGVSYLVRSSLQKLVSEAKQPRVQRLLEDYLRTLTLEEVAEPESWPILQQLREIYIEVGPMPSITDHAKIWLILAQLQRSQVVPYDLRDKVDNLRALSNPSTKSWESIFTDLISICAKNAREQSSIINSCLSLAGHDRQEWPRAYHRLLNAAPQEPEIIFYYVALGLGVRGYEDVDRAQLNHSRDSLHSFLRSKPNLVSSIDRIMKQLAKQPSSAKLVTAWQEFCFKRELLRQQHAFPLTQSISQSFTQITESALRFFGKKPSANLETGANRPGMQRGQSQEGTTQRTSHVPQKVNFVQSRLPRQVFMIYKTDATLVAEAIHHDIFGYGGTIAAQNVFDLVGRPNPSSLTENAFLVIRLAGLSLYGAIDDMLVQGIDKNLQTNVKISWMRSIAAYSIVEIPSIFSLQEWAKSYLGQLGLYHVLQHQLPAPDTQPWRAGDILLVPSRYLRTEGQ